MSVELDAVDVAAPREFHAEMVRMAARRGLAVLCQKPLAPTLAEAEALVAEVGGRCRLMVHENWRFGRTTAICAAGCSKAASVRWCRGR